MSTYILLSRHDFDWSQSVVFLTIGVTSLPRLYPNLTVFLRIARDDKELLVFSHSNVDVMSRIIVHEDSCLLLRFET